MMHDEINKLLPYFEDGSYYGSYQGESYETAYHTSKLRENLINWYPFKKDSSVLALSFGAGALIPYLCRNASSVTVLENDEENCSVIKARCAGLSNIRIIQADFMDYPLDERFDYIIAIDYLAGHLKNPNENNFMERFLYKSQKNLNEGGKLLMALNNAMGLKYLNGAYCDSKDMELFDSLKQPDFFTKGELEDIFRKSGMCFYKFYYPFPDYAFPRSIYTDESLKSMRFGHHYNDYNLDRYSFFDEFKMYRRLQENGIVDRFSNSFFIELSKGSFADNGVIYAKNQYFVDKEYKTATIVYSGDKKYAEKKPLTPEAGEHLHKLYNDSVKLNSSRHCFNYISYSYDQETCTLHMPYIEGASVSDQLEIKLKDLEATHDVNRIYKDILGLLSEIYDQMKTEAQKKRPDEIFNQTFQKNFGEAVIEEPLDCLNSVTLDMHLDHIFPGEDGFHVIDIDPIEFFNVPIDYLMWCLIESWHYTYIYKNAFLEQVIHTEQLSSDLGIRAEHIEIFKKWRGHVFNNASAVSQIQPFYSRKFSPVFLPYSKIEEYGQKSNNDSRVMNAMKKGKAGTFRLDKTVPIVLYGASAVGKLFYNILSRRDYQVIGFIDKRHDEIADINGCPVFSIDQKINDPCVVIIAIKNVFEQEKIAKELFKRGYERLIYRPKKIVDGECDDQLQIINDTYDEIERFKWIGDDSIPLELDYDIPKITGFPRISLKDTALRSAYGDKVIASIPIMYIYSAQQKLMPDYPWAEKSIVTLVPHTALYKYLWDGGEDKTKWYIDFCSYGARNNNVEITQRWKQNLIDNRLIVLTAMKKSLEQDFNFFYRNPPEGIWNEEKGYFNLNGGRHRAALFVYENFYTMPLEICREDYERYLNLPVLKKVEEYMQRTDMDSLEAPVAHPYFLNIPCKRPQYYQCIIKPLIEFLAEKDLEAWDILQFDKYKFHVFAGDHGELKRYLAKSGFSVHNMSREDEFEALLDELFYTSCIEKAEPLKEYCFFDISLKGRSILDEYDNRINNAGTLFIMADEKDMRNVEQFMSEKPFKDAEILKRCYWDSQNILLLAFERED